MNGLPKGDNLEFIRFLAQRQRVTLREAYGMAAAAVGVQHLLAEEGVVDGIHAHFATASRKLLATALGETSPAAAAAAFAESQAASKVLEGLRGLIDLIDREERVYLETLKSGSEEEMAEW